MTRREAVEVVVAAQERIGCEARAVQLGGGAWAVKFQGDPGVVTFFRSADAGRYIAQRER